MCHHLAWKLFFGQQISHRPLVDLAVVHSIVDSSSLYFYKIFFCFPFSIIASPIYRNQSKFLWPLTVGEVVVSYEKVS